MKLKLNTKFNNELSQKAQLCSSNSYVSSPISDITMILSLLYKYAKRGLTQRSDEGRIYKNPAVIEIIRMFV